MEQREDRQEKNVIRPGALITDTSYVDQPQGTTSFVLNAVNETDEGDRGKRTTEESNAPCYGLPIDYIPVGDVYIGNEEKLMFLASAAGNSKIVILDSECNITTIFDDAEQEEKIGFKVSHPIMATFRLRRGCERTVYFVIPKPMIFIIDKEEQFKNDLGNWDISKFKLFKTYKIKPIIESLVVNNSGGVLAPGSYNIAHRYLDEDLNPTEFTITTETLEVYNNSFENSYASIRGSSIKESDLYKGTLTNKSIAIRFSEMDETFPYYQLAFIEANNGSGLISNVKYSAEISTRNKNFTYTGTNFESTGTIEEVTTFNNIIDSAEVIEQIENRLLLENVKGKQLNMCVLQRYASRIQVDCRLKPILLTQIGGANSKTGNAHYEGIGYMPGEIYSLAIVYVFDDNTETPALHISGKAPSTVNSTFLSNNETVTYYPMSIDNASEDNLYVDNDTCDNLGYWGVDSEGVPLKDTPVRHHRFPLRSEIGKPLFTQEINSQTEIEMQALRFEIRGDIPFPAPCPPEGDPDYDPDCVDATLDDVADIEYTIEYTVDGETNYYSDIITAADWDPDTIPGYELFLDPVLSSSAIVIVSVKENDIVVPYDDTGVSVNGLTYKVTTQPYVVQSESKLYYSEIFGMEFSNIEMPALEDTGGNKIVGYYIVRQERVEDEKTILDSAVLTSTMQNENFVSHGMLMPNFDSPTDERINRDFISMINPEFKFRGRTYTEIDHIIKEGEYTQSGTGPINSGKRVQDVIPGTSYDSKRHKKSQSDPDGWDLLVRTRDNILNYAPVNEELFIRSDINEVFYLDALTYKSVEDSTETIKNVYNLACDNKIGIISLKEEYAGPIVNTLPYVILKRDIANPYANFRTIPYYKENKNLVLFEENVISRTVVFNGDSYINSMRYFNSLFYENRVKKRITKKGVLSIIIGAVLIVVGAILAIWTGGSSLALAAAGAAIIAGASLLSSGLEQQNWNAVYNDLYKQGLRETVEDDFLENYAKVVNPIDDEIRWFGDCLTDIWFESQVNFGLRQGVNIGGLPDFLDSPGVAKTGNEIGTPATSPSRIIGSNYDGDGNDLDAHLIQKTTILNQENDDAKEYIAIALPEMYTINPDYFRRNKEKIYNHLALEYDCCSDCFETFPHRAFYSEQAFQEELTDNYRTFLANNYIDIEGETGVITDSFRFRDKLYIHTAEALWEIPNSRQERITQDNIISFIGTGEFFAIKPRKIVDDMNSSAGNIHRVARIKTKYGILFPSHKEKKWYLFDGEKLDPITDYGNSNWFKENMRFLMAEQYYLDNKASYPYADNPSNPIGIGYLSVYDTKKERLIVSKKDFKLTQDLGEGYELCNEGASTIIFPNIADTITTKEADGYTFIGIEGCRLKFQKTEFETRTETRQIIQTVPNDAHVYFVYDISGSFSTGTYLADLQTAATAWYDSFRPSDPTHTMLHHINNSSERWIFFPSLMVADTSIHGGKILLVSLVNEASTIYHSSTLVTPPLGEPTMTTPGYSQDYTDFRDTILPQYSFFVGITYPIATIGAPYTNSKQYIQHTLLALKGLPYTLTEANAIPMNAAFTIPEWDALKANLQLANPYTSLGVGAGTLGWQAKVDRNDYAVIAETQDAIITPQQFTDDINALLADSTVTTEIEVEVQVPITTYDYIDGDTIDLNNYNNGWTMSYSLKDKQWIGWHSYIPHYYLYLQEKFFSWKVGLIDIYKHNAVKGSFLIFYGQTYPFILEFVDNKNAVQTKLWDGYTFQTEAKTWHFAHQEFNDINLTFNRLLAYNSNQISGMLSLVLKSLDENYLTEQTINTPGQIFIDRNERDWTINELRDMRINYDLPMLIKDLGSRQNTYFIDKIVNTDVVSFDKNWTELESFRDKFLVVRLIFDNFTNVRLSMNFSLSDDKASQR